MRHYTTQRLQRGRRRQIENEREARTPAPARLQLQLGAHRLDQSAADCETETGPGEVVARRARGLTAERLVERLECFVRDPGPCIAHGKLDAGATQRARGQRHASVLRELEGVRREVEQDAAQGDRVPDAPRRAQSLDVQLESLLLRGRAHEIVNVRKDLVYRKCTRLLGREAMTATGHLDHVAAHPDEAERCTVDDTDLALLNVVECAALSSVKDLGQEEDRSQRRAHVVRYFDREVEAAAVGKLGGERLLQRRSARALRCFESLQRRDHLRSVRRALAPRLDDLLAQQLDKSATERERRTIL